MSRFTDTVRADTPRFVVEFKRVNNEEQFSWGMSGPMPIITLIGTLVRIQNEVGLYLSDPQFNDGDAHYCDMMALVVAWDAGTKQFNWFVNPAIPQDSLVGMLEIINATLVTQHIMRQQAATKAGIIGPDGRPMRRGIT